MKRSSFLLQFRFPLNKNHQVLDNHVIQVKDPQPESSNKHITVVGALSTGIHKVAAFIFNHYCHVITLIEWRVKQKLIMCEKLAVLLQS